RARWKLDQTEITKVEVIALKRSGAEWKMMLPDVVRTMADTFQRTLQIGNPEQKRVVPDAPSRAKDAANLQGTWRLVAEIAAGKKSDLTTTTSEWVIARDRVTA